MRKNINSFTLLKSISKIGVFTIIFVALCFVGGQMAIASDIVPGTVSTDQFDSTQGTIVVDDDTIIDPINAFRVEGGFETGHTLMRNGGLNSVSFINFDTPSAVSIIGVRLFAHNDLPYALRRAMNHFKLFADVDGDSVFETTVVDVPIAPDYQSQPGNIATDISNLDITLLASGTITSQHWRLEVTQGSDIQPFEGARLVELDAIPSDIDHDGIIDDVDDCPDTNADEVVNEHGCSIDQLCPCNDEWKNHGDYVSCVAHASEDFVEAGLITEGDKDAIVSEAGESSCGKKTK